MSEKLTEAVAQAGNIPAWLKKKHATKRIYKQRFAAFLYRSDKIRTCDLRLPKAAL